MSSCLITYSNDTTGQPGTSMTSGLAVRKASPAQIIFISMHLQWMRQENIGL